MDVTCPKRDIGAYEQGCASALPGTINVGGAFPPFTSPATAATLLTECGLDGPVRFEIATGTYNEKVVIQNICNSNATNTVTFASASGVATDVVITSPSSGSGADNYTVFVNDVDYIAFEALTIERTGNNTYASVVNMHNGAEHQVFTAVRFVANHPAPTTHDQTLVYGTMNAMPIGVHYFMQCEFDGGYAGLHYPDMGGSYDLLEVTGSSFTNQRGYGIAIFSDYDNVTIEDNEMTTNAVVGTYTGIYSLSADLNHDVIANRVSLNPAGSYSAVGIHLIGNALSPGGSLLSVINNEVNLQGSVVGGSLGLFLNNCRDFDIVHNTVAVSGSAAAAIRLDHSFGGVPNSSVYNNIFVHRTPVALAADYRVNALTWVGSNISHNLYYNGYTGGLIKHGAITYATATDWVFGSGLETSVYEQDPSFFSASDLQPQPSSIVSRLGTPIWSEDRLSVIRSGTAPTLGAYEVICGGSPYAGTYTVGLSGYFASVEAAIGALNQCGMAGAVTLDIETGTYNERVTIGPILGLGATPADTLTLQSQSGNRQDVAISQPTGSTASQNYVLGLYQSGYVTIKDLTIARVGTDPFATALRIFGPADSVHLFNDSLRSEGLGGGSSFSEALVTTTGWLDDFQMVGCAVRSNSGGVYISGTSSQMSEDLLLADNNILFDSYNGLYITFSQRVDITGNTIVSNTIGNITNGILLSDVYDQGQVSGNFVHAEETAIYLLELDSYGNGFAVQNNVAVQYGTGFGAALLIQDGVYMDVLHNTLVAYGSGSSTALMLDAYSVHSFDCSFYNNILANLGNGVALWATNDGPTMISSLDYNQYYVANISDIIDYDFNIYTTVTDFNIDYAFESNGLEADPQFANPPADDYSIGLCSPSFGVGLNVGVTEDIEGTSRSATPTIGAYEVTVFTGPLAGTYSIGPTGDYPTFNDALCALKVCGVNAAVVFDVEPGVYNEQLYIPFISGSGAINTITFRGVPADRTDVEVQHPAGTTLDDDYVVMIEDGGYIRFEDMVLGRTGSNTHATPVQLIGINDDIRFDNTVLYNQQATDTLLVVLGTVVDLEVTNSHFSGGAVGVNQAAGYLQYAVIANNTFQNQAEVGIWASQVITRNRIDNNQFGTSSALNDGINLASGYGDLSIQNNKVYFKRYGITVSGLTNGLADSIIVANNVIYDDVADVTSHIGLRFFNSDYAYLAHNSVYIANSNAGSVAFLYGGGFGTATNKIYNNIFANYGAGFVLSVGSGGASYIISSAFNRNILYAASNPNPIMWAGGSYASISAWRVAFPSIPNTQSGDNPLWVSPPTNFAVQACSYAIKGGISAGYYIPTTDFQGTGRNLTQPTIGAYEPYCPAGPLAGTYGIGASGDYTTIASAVCDLNACGISDAVRFDIATGTYTEQINLPAIDGASATDTIVFASATLNPAHVEVTTSTGSFVWVFNAADYITLEALTIKPTGSTTAGIRLLNECKNLRFINDSLHTNVVGSIGLQHTGTGSSSDWQMLNTAFTGIGQAINLNPADSISNLVIRDSRFSGQHQSVSVMAISNVRNLTLTRNQLANNTETDGLTLNSIRGEITIAQNDIFAEYNSSVFIAVNGSIGQPARIVNNVFNSVNTDASPTSAMTVVASSHLDIYHNTFQIDNTSGGTPTVQFDNITVVGSVNFVNNALKSDATNLPLNVTPAATGGFNSMDHNLYYASGGPELAYWGISTAANLGDLQGFSGLDGNSLEADPQFTSLTNLLPLNTSPLALAGTPVSVTVDIRDSTRSLTTPTIGAYELECGLMTVDADSVDVSCNGGTNGSLTVTVTGGLAPYEYSLDNFATSQPGNVFTGLPAGSYLVYVKDANNCTAQLTAPITVDQPALLSGSVNPTDVTCFGRNDGTVTVTPVGGVPPYEYAIDGGPYGPDSIFTGLAPLLHSIDVRDANSCVFNTNANVNDRLSGPSLSIKALLEGPYLPGPQTMGDSLNKPAYTILDNLYGFGGLGDTSGVYGDTTMLATYNVPAGAVDLVKIEVRTGTAASTKVDSAYAWLMTDGTIRDFRTGTRDYLIFCNLTPMTSYYVVVYHRNHLPIMSANPVYIDNDPPVAPYDLTDPANIYGPDGAKVVGGKALMYAANAYDDPVFDWSEINANDFFYVIIDTDFPSSPHYIKTDVNLDGKLNALDFDIVSWNNDNLYRSAVPR